MLLISSVPWLSQLPKSIMATVASRKNLYATAGESFYLRHKMYINKKGHHVAPFNLTKVFITLNY
jgi:hypothetical protein